jgi:hypothetical protein
LARDPTCTEALTEPRLKLFVIHVSGPRKHLT